MEILSTMIFGGLVLILIMDSVLTTEDGVLLKSSEFQKITSNTLKWVSPPSPGSIPTDAVIGSIEYTLTSTNENDEDDLQLHMINGSQIQENKIYICRAFLEGIWIPGAVFEHTDACMVSTVVKVHFVEQYDILINIDQAARLIWQNWERQREIPVGAVSAGEYYIAHSASSKLNILNEKLAIGMVYRIGKIDPQEGIFGKMSVIDEDKVVINDVDSGQVLIEIEPSFYELTITNLYDTRSKILRQQTLTLGEVTLRNDDNRDMKAEAVIPYEWNYESSWGQGKAMSKALETRIQFKNTTIIEVIEWGIIHAEKKSGIEKVERFLNSGAASHVTIVADYAEIEVPYTGTLLSIFSDNHTMNRTIHGIWKYTALRNIVINYGPLYFILNNTLIPTTIAPSTTTHQPTTNVMTSIQKNQSNEKHFDLPLNNSHKIPSPNESDAMQLKEKENPDRNASTANCFSLYVTLCSVIIISLSTRVLKNNLTLFS